MIRIILNDSTDAVRDGGRWTIVSHAGPDVAVAGTVWEGTFLWLALELLARWQGERVGLLAATAAITRLQDLPDSAGIPYWVQEPDGSGRRRFIPPGQVRGIYETLARTLVDLVPWATKLVETRPVPAPVDVARLAQVLARAEPLDVPHAAYLRMAHAALAALGTRT